MTAIFFWSPMAQISWLHGPPREKMKEDERSERLLASFPSQEMVCTKAPRLITGGFSWMKTKFI